MSEALQRVAARLARARRVLFITGAGMSADSGLPTYRGVGGLYQETETDEGIAIEEALSGPMMRRRPELSWKYIMQIERACRGAAPNRGHEIIAGLEERLEVCVLTQNVDGLHRRAGSTRIIDIHGDVRNLLCTRCPHRRTVPDYDALPCPPRCPECDAIVRPDVVLFGEMLPLPKVARLRAELAAGFDVIFSVGTTSVFPYIAEPILDPGGALTVEINPGRTAVSNAVDERMEGRASACLERLHAILNISSV